MSEVILLARDGAVATVMLNRPDKMNALNLEMWRGLADAFEALAEDESVRCIVLRGAGEQAFAPGADIAEFDTHRADAEQAKAYDVVMRRALDAVRLCPHPVVAMIYGPCVGGALELASMCDIRVSAESGRFGVPIGRISVVMAYPELRGLQRLIGHAKMREILLEAKVVGAAEALAMGLVNRVVPDSALAAEVAATTRRIVQNAPLVNRWHKKFIERLTHPDPITASESEEAYVFLATDDYAEGVAAFKEKRKPDFQGK